MDDEKCKGWTNRWRCNFEARYDEGKPTLTRADDLAPWHVAEILEASKPLTYVCDVCTACGKQIVRPESPR